MNVYGYDDDAACCYFNAIQIITFRISRWMVSSGSVFSQ